MCPTERDEGQGSLARAAALFAAFDQSTTRLSYAELARRVHLPRSTVHRMAKELTRLGWLEERDGRLQLGMKLFEYGLLVPRRRSVTEAAAPLMEDLRQATGFAVHLATLDGLEVVYLEILHPKVGPKMPSRVGGRLPSHATGVGKAMLAYSPAETEARIAAGLPRITPYTVSAPGTLARELASIRASGVSYDREESTLGVSCAAAPIFGRGPGGSTRCVAALSVSGPTRRLDPPRMGPAVRTAALTLSRILTTNESG